MKFAKTIVYVEDAEASLKFFEQAFGFKATYYGNGYGEVETGGDSKISFADYAVGQSHLSEVGAPGRIGFELSLVSETVEEDFKRAVAAGAEAAQGTRADAVGTGLVLPPAPGRHHRRPRLAGRILTTTAEPRSFAAL